MTTTRLNADIVNALQEIAMAVEVRDTIHEPAPSLGDVVQELTRIVAGLSQAVLPKNAAPARLNGGFVGSLTEAVMAVADGAHRIADALEAMHQANERPHLRRETFDGGNAQ